MVKMRYDFNGAASIGIIGGKDGPTAIYIAKKRRTPWISLRMRRFLAGAGIVTAALIAVVRLAGVRRRRK